MMALENISSSGTANGISFTNLNNSFETGRIHGIWNEADSVNTGFLQLLTGNIPLSSGIIRYQGKRLDHADLASIVRLYKMIQPLKQLGRTILITSTDYKALKAPTDFFHILSKGAFQARLHAKQYHLLDDVFRHVQRS
jgi:ABC-type sugar transport system ATPase subunit